MVRVGTSSYICLQNIPFGVKAESRPAALPGLALDSGEQLGKKKKKEEAKMLLNHKGL